MIFILKFIEFAACEFFWRWEGRSYNLEMKTVVPSLKFQNNFVGVQTVEKMREIFYNFF